MNEPCHNKVKQYNLYILVKVILLDILGFATKSDIIKS